MAARSEPLLLKLPVELRTQIFELVISSHLITVHNAGFMLPRGPYVESYTATQNSITIERHLPSPNLDPPAIMDLALLRTCRDTYYEARFILYRSSVFVFNSFPLCRMFLRNCLLPEYVAAIRSVAFDLPLASVDTVRHDTDAELAMRSLTGAKSMIILYRHSVSSGHYGYGWHPRIYPGKAIRWLTKAFHELNVAQLILGNTDVVTGRLMEETLLGQKIFHHSRESNGRGFIDLLTSESTIYHRDDAREGLYVGPRVWVMSLEPRRVSGHERELACQYYEDNLAHLANWSPGVWIYEHGGFA